jgi:hypothetical protein
LPNFHPFSMPWLKVIKVQPIVVDLVLIEQMLWSQISRGMQNTTQKFDWQIICPLLLLMNSQLLSFSKRCWFRPTAEINPRHFLSLLCCSPSLHKSFSLCLSLTPSCLIPDHDLPGLISHKNLMIRMFDYHWMTINVWGHFVVSLRRLLTMQY